MCDELGDGSFGWIAHGSQRRCAHALAVDGRVYLVDPFDADGLEERVRAAGKPAGVIQLLDRHDRDSAALARRLGVPLHRLEAPTPFTAIPLRTPPRWNEVALWWPERRVLVCGDALGTPWFFLRTPGKRLGIHPLLRPTPPRRLAELDAQHVLCGHGEGVHADAAAAVGEAVAAGWRRLPAAAIKSVRDRRQSLNPK